MGRNSEVRSNWRGQEEFDIYFCMFFDCYCRDLNVSTKIWDFPNTSLFSGILNVFFSCVGTKAPPAAKMPWGKCWLVQQLVRHLVHQVSYTRYHVSFYLWLIGSVLEHCKVPKYYDQDCRSLFHICANSVKSVSQISGTKNYKIFQKLEGSFF